MTKISNNLHKREKLIIFLNLILLVLLIIIIKNYSETIPLKTIKSNDLKISLYIVPDFKTKLHSIRILFKNKSEKNKIKLELSKNNFEFKIQNKRTFDIIFSTKIFTNESVVIKELSPNQTYWIKFQVYPLNLNLKKSDKCNIYFRYKNLIINNVYTFFI